MNQQIQDVAIVGASFAGLSAALFLGNTLRPVAVIDDGYPRNFQAQHTHNVLGFENANPLEYLHQVAREVSQLHTVKFYKTRATSIHKREPNLFFLNLESGDQIVTKKIILATGVVDRLPNIPGINEFWPQNIFQCPYCIAPELKNEPLAVMSDNEEACFLASIISKWTSDLVLLTNGAAALSDSESKYLKEKGIRIYNAKITKVSGTPGKEIFVHFDDQQKLLRRGIFIHLPYEQRAANLLADLGCLYTDDNLVKVDERYQTSVSGVYAIGDMSQRVQKISTAMASGTVAGFALDHTLTEENLNT